MPYKHEQKVEVKENTIVLKYSARGTSRVSYLGLSAWNPDKTWAATFLYILRFCIVLREII